MLARLDVYAEAQVAGDGGGDGAYHSPPACRYIISVMGTYMNKAREFHRQAVAELEEWKLSRANDVLICDAAEKAWGAVTQAANEIIAAADGTKETPSGSNGRRYILRELEKRYRNLRTLRLADRYNSAQIVLHALAFYDGDYRPSAIEEWITEDAKEYLDDVEGAIGHLPRG